jgi:putative transposase
MIDLPWLSPAQMRKIEPYFPVSRGVPRSGDRRVLSGIIFVIRNGRQWQDAPFVYGPPKTLCQRFNRWSRLGVFDRILSELADMAGTSGKLMIDATHLKAHPTAARLLKKGLFPRMVSTTKGGRKAKRHTPELDRPWQQVNRFAG